MAERLRDRKGRFVRAKKPPPLDPQLVASLREGQPAYENWAEIPIELVISERSRDTPTRPWKVTRQGEVIDEE